MAKKGRNARPAKALEARRERQLRDMPTDIENIVSQVVGQDSYNPTAEMEDSFMDKVRNRLDNIRGVRKGRNVARGTLEFAPGGRVEECGGDVRYNRKRGKTY